MPSAFCSRLFTCIALFLQGNGGKTDVTVDGTEIVEDNNDDKDADDNPRLLSDVMACWDTEL